MATLTIVHLVWSQVLRVVAVLVDEFGCLCKYHRNMLFCFLVPFF